MVWHLVFGVEVGIEALLSPTHLVLASGGALVLSAALRAGWARPVAVEGSTLRTELPAVLSLTLVTALAVFFLLYVSVFGRPAVLEAPTQIPEGAPGHDAAEMSVVVGLASYVVTSVVIVMPLLLAQRAGRRPRGAVLVLIVVVSWLSAAVTGFTGYGLITAGAVTVAAAALEVVFDLVQRSRLPRSALMPVVGALVPGALWTAQIAALAVGPGLAWPPELWAGVVGLAALAAAALGVVVGWVPSAAVDVGEAEAGWPTPRMRRRQWARCGSTGRESWVLVRSREHRHLGAEPHHLLR